MDGILLLYEKAHTGPYNSSGMKFFGEKQLSTKGVTGASPRKFLCGGFVKSWTFYTGKYSDLSEGATKTK